MSNDINQQTAGCEVGVYNPHKHLAATDRLIHLAMDELASARACAQSQVWAVSSANDQNQKLATELSRTLSQVKLLQQDMGEMASVLNLREEEIRKLKGVRDAAMAELNAIDQDPTKSRIRQLLKRIREMAPQAQFKVLTHTGRQFQILGALSTNGVTTITVSPRPASR